MRSMFNRILAATVLVVIFGAGAIAQENSLTLDDCIELALQKRASVIAARGAESLAKAGQRNAIGAFLPRINASYDYYKTKQREQTSQFDDLPEVELPDQEGDGTSWSVSGSMTLFDLSNFFNYASARAERAAARLDVLDSEQALIYAVKLSYYAYLANVENVEVQQQAVARADEQLKLITSRYDLGSASLSDVLKQRVQSGNDKLALLRARNAVVTSRANLAFTIGLDPNDDVGFATDYTVREIEGTLEEAVEYGMTHEPGLLAAEKNVSAARNSVRSGYSNYLPSLGGYARYTVSDGSSGDTLFFNFSSKTTTYGFSVDWSIFDGFIREGRVTSAKVSLNNNKAYLADTRNLVTQAIKSAYFEIEQQKEAKNVASQNVEWAQEDLKITQEKYKLGAATILDLLDAQVSLKQAQVALIQADFDLNLAIADLENSMGKM